MGDLALDAVEAAPYNQPRVQKHPTDTRGIEEETSLDCPVCSCYCLHFVANFPPYFQHINELPRATFFFFRKDANKAAYFSAWHDCR